MAGKKKVEPKSNDKLESQISEIIIRINELQKVLNKYSDLTNRVADRMGLSHEV